MKNEMKISKITELRLLKQFANLKFYVNSQINNNYYVDFNELIRGGAIEIDVEKDKFSVGNFFLLRDKNGGVHLFLGHKPFNYQGLHSKKGKNMKKYVVENNIVQGFMFKKSIHDCAKVRRVRPMLNWEKCSNVHLFIEKRLSVRHASEKEKEIVGVEIRKYKRNHRAFYYEDELKWCKTNLKNRLRQYKENKVEKIPLDVISNRVAEVMKDYADCATKNDFSLILKKYPYSKSLSAHDYIANIAVKYGRIVNFDDIGVKSHLWEMLKKQ